eukprot:m.122625 g.122625  ORF g.122625 m.122625 type:complete len:104 (+) comp13427_c0_seq3:419-730(+)
MQSFVLGVSCKAMRWDFGSIDHIRTLQAVYTSDLGRARHTAEMIMLESALADSNVPLIRDARLREQNFGALEGVHESQLTTEQRTLSQCCHLYCSSSWRRISR